MRLSEILSSKIRKKALLLYKRGSNKKEIAKIFFCNVSYISILAKEDNWPKLDGLHQSKNNTLPKEYENICKKATNLYYNYGLNYTEIAKRLLITSRSILSIAYKYSWNEIPNPTKLEEIFRKNWSLAKEKRVIKLYCEKGCNFKQIAEKVDSTVYEVVYLLIVLCKIRTKCKEYKNRHVKFLTNHEEKDIIDLFKSGMTYTEIEIHNRRYNCPLIKRVLKKHRLYIPRKKLDTFTSRDKRQDKRIISLYKQGYSGIDISNKFGFSNRIIYRVLNLYGVKTRHLGNKGIIKKSILKAYLDKKFSVRNLIKSWYKYNQIVRALTEVSYRKFYTKIDPKGLRGICKKTKREFHLDHILSIHDAFTKYKKPIDPRIIAHPSNLRILPKIRNLSKYSRSGINISNLKKRIKASNIKISKIISRQNIGKRNVF